MITRNETKQRVEVQLNDASIHVPYKPSNLRRLRGLGRACDGVCVCGSVVGAVGWYKAAEDIGEELADNCLGVTRRGATAAEDMEGIDDIGRDVDAGGRSDCNVIPSNMLISSRSTMLVAGMAAAAIASDSGSTYSCAADKSIPELSK